MPLLPPLLEAIRLNVDVHPHHYAQQFPDPTGGNKAVTERWEQEKTPLGSGGFGKVWKVAETGGARRTRAVKVVAKAVLALPELEGLVTLNEYEGHFTRFFGWWEHKLEIYILMEFMPGGNLQKLIAGEVTEDEAVDIARQILRGIAIMHSRHIIHRDLKPANILLANVPGTPLDLRIADLGSCKHLTQSEAKTRGPGTPGYTAPEVLHAPGKINEASSYSSKADMWSLGCLMHAVFTGHSPYATDDSLPKPTALQTTFPPHEKNLLGHKKVSDLGVDFITLLVQVDPAKRPTAKVALTHRWLL